MLFEDFNWNHFYVLVEKGFVSVCDWRELGLEPLSALEQKKVPYYLDEEHALDVAEAQIKFLERQLDRSKEFLLKQRKALANEASF